MKRGYKIFAMVLLISSLGLITPQQLAVAQITPSQFDGTIKIGSLGPLAIPVGVDMENGAIMAVNEINNDGGITISSGTYELELITETTSSASTGLPDPNVAATSISKLVETDNVAAILGGFRTEVVLSIQPYINSTEVPFLGVGSTAALITEFFYRVGPPNGTTLARNVISFYATHLAPAFGVSDIVIVREDAVWADAIAGAAIAVLNNDPFNLNVDPTTIPIDEGASGSDISSALNFLLEDQETDAIMTLFSAPVGEAVTEQWASMGLNERMFLAGINVAAQDSEYFEVTEGATAGEMTIETAPPGVEPTAQTSVFRDAYENLYDEKPTYTSFAAYDAVYIIKDAIVRADSYERSAIHSVLPDTDYTGSVTRYKFTTESSAGQVASPAVPQEYKQYDNATVHDLYTPSTVGVPGFPYSQPYMAQWYENGTKGAVWGGTATGFAPAIEPPYEAEVAGGGPQSDEGIFPIATWTTFLLALVPIMMVKLKTIKRKDK